VKWSYDAYYAHNILQAVTVHNIGLKLDKCLLILQCHHLVEAKEEVIENWWFKHYAKGVDTDLNSYLCVSRMKGLHFHHVCSCIA